MPKNTLQWLGVLLAILIGIVWLDVRSYQGNISALFHIDQNLAQAHPMPKGTIIYTVPGYDGMEYYQIARNLPLLLQRHQWRELTMFPPGSYAYQRIMLPIVGYLFALGQAPLLPYSFLLIQFTSLLGTFFLLLKRFRSPLFAFALALCPATAVALHFSLAEPLSILLITIFLLRFEKKEQIDTTSALVLSAIVLSREINIFFVVATLCYVLYKKKWQSAAYLLIPIAVCMAWHGYIYAIFHQIPFLMSTEKRALPFTAIIDILIGKNPYTLLTRTSIALFLVFVLPGTILSIHEILRTKSIRFVPCMALFFFVVMLSVPDFIWGSITSIGRVITPTYPLFIFMIASRATRVGRIAAFSLLILGIATAIGLALSTHPFLIAS